MPTSFVRDCWFLTGPTACGKTAVGIELARRLDAEIVSVDSMALYRGMDIGTAKPTAAQRTAVTHHLIDVVDPREDFSIARYLEAARRSVEAIQGRGRTALFVGGTPLYLKGLLRGIFEGPPADWELRRRLLAEAADAPGLLHRRLAEVDPIAAAKLHPNDLRRIVRALEVFHGTGRPISAWQEQFDRATPAEACRVFVLMRPREDLYARIDARVDAMFASGFVEEVRQLTARPQPPGRTAMQALGYHEVAQCVQGRRSLAATIDLVKVHTRQFAKRQLTWFRSLTECRSLEAPPDQTASGLAERLVAMGRDAHPLK
jgi:tRNA dimethylallyltransferase